MKFEHGGNVLHYSKNLNISEKDILDFSVNLTPLGYPTYIKDEILNNFHRIYYYPEIFSDSLKSVIGDKFNCSPDNIIVGNGSTQLIYLLPLALALKSPIIVHPTFSEYDKSLKISNIRPSYFILDEESDFNLNIDRLIIFLKRRKYDSLYLCNPSNPVGTILDDDKVLYLANYLNRNSKYFILDEAFIDFTHYKGLILHRVKNLILLRSLTKIFGIAGLRLGYLKTSLYLAKKLTKFIQPWSVNAFSDIIGRNLLSDDKFIIQTRDYIDKERDYFLKNFFNHSNFKIFNSCTNYFLIKIIGDFELSDFKTFLLSNNIFVRDCSNFIGLSNKFFRIGINTRENNIKLLEIINNFQKGREEVYK